MKNRFITKHKRLIELLASIFAVFIFIFSFSVIFTAQKNDNIKVGSYEFVSSELGTFTSPYIIDSPSDLIKLSTNVNGGNSFDGKFFKQTCDLDMSNVNFVPIGVVGTNKYFSGTYIGGGHLIKNLNVSGEHLGSTENALFGFLHGSVYGVGIEGGSISGSTASGIACHAKSDTAIIANCYSNATLIGTNTFGIVGDFSGGTIVNSYSISKNENGFFVPLCSNNLQTISNCYSAGKLFLEETENLSESNFENATETILSSNFFEKLNSNLKTSQSLGCISQILPSFKFENDKTVFVQDNAKTYEFFSGHGTKTSPYKISSISELYNLSAYVMAGENFHGKTIQQVCNVDFENSVFLPIGLYASGRYFFGTYDGNGYKISNIHVNSSKCSGNNGLFGMLDGTVMNVFIDGGLIEGGCCGTISSHSRQASANIVNCVSTATLNSSRKGAFVDNFYGHVNGCVYFNETDSLAISSYSVTYAKYNFTNSETILPERAEIASNNETIDKTMFLSEEFAEKINSNLAFVSAESGVELSRLNYYGTNEKVNPLKYFLKYPKNFISAFKFNILGFVAIITSVILIAVTFIFEIRRNRNRV